MASFLSVQKDEAAKLCQFCEESGDIRYKCVNCDLLLCEICNTTLHRKKAFSMHEVINLGGCVPIYATKVMREIELKDMPCEVHTEQKCCVFCTECDVPICPICVTRFHSNHKFKNLRKVYNTLRFEMIRCQNETGSTLSFFKNDRTKLQAMLTQGEQVFQNAKTEILQQEARLKETVTKQAKELLRDLETKWNPTEQKLKKEIEEVKKNKENLENRKEILQKALQSPYVKDIYITGKYLDKTLPRKTETKIKLKEMKFIHANENNHSREILFGKLNRPPEMKVVESFSTDLDAVTNICILDDPKLPTALIGSFLKDRILRMYLKKNQSKVLSELNGIYVYDMTKTNNGDVLLSTKARDIKILSQTYGHQQLEILYSFAGLFTLGLCVTKQNEILVGLTNSKILTPPRSNSIRKIVSLTVDSDNEYVEYAYEYDQLNRRLFTWPRKIIKKDNLMCVVDLLNREYEGRVAAIDKGGQLLWTYTGVNASSKFFPRNIVFTPTDLILVSDSENHAIHALNSDGQLVFCQIMTELGIELPYSLDIDKKGLLLIGCDTFQDDEDTCAMIYKVRFT